MVCLIFRKDYYHYYSEMITNDNVGLIHQGYFYTSAFHSGEGIYGCRSHNAKLFERIEHSGIW